MQTKTLEYIIATNNITQDLIYQCNSNKVEVYIKWNTLIEILENKLYDEVLKINQLIIDFREFEFINEELFQSCLNKYFLFHGYPFNIITE